MTFESVQHLDNIIANALVWKNTTGAALASDFLQWSLMLAPFVVVAVRKEWKRLILVGAITLTVSLLVSSNKFVVGRERPNHEDTRSFFSGHTASAFTGAGLVCTSLPLLACAPSMVVATTVGYLRIAANKHWSSDVLVGMLMGLIFGLGVPILVKRF